MTLLSSWSFGQAVRMDDQSDWWSIPNESSQEPQMKVRGEALATENFQIAGVSLENDNPQQVEAKLGKAKPVQRGDASTGREQLCYVSGTAREKLHLIFDTAKSIRPFICFLAAQPGKEWNAASPRRRSPGW
jgi:hypothetical protein